MIRHFRRFVDLMNPDSTSPIEGELLEVYDAAQKAIWNALADEEWESGAKEKTMIVVGCDPGKAGALVALTLHKNADPPQIAVFETAREFLLPGRKRAYATGAMALRIRQLTKDMTGGAGDLDLAVIETPSAPFPAKGNKPGSGGKVGRQVLGIGYGLWVGILAAYRVPTLEISPPVWQNRMLKGHPGTGKERAIGVAMGWLPHLELPKARARAETIAEAACLAILGAQELAAIERKLPTEGSTPVRVGKYG